MSRLRFLLYPLSVLYNGITGLRNQGFDRSWWAQTSFDIPIIAVGNLSTGGTGKTPMIEYLIRQNSEKKLAVLSRGYGRKTKGYLEVFSNSKAVEVGDEPLQFKLKFRESVIVAVCEKRVEGIKRLLAEYDLDLILLDDAYQHRHVKASKYILLTSYDQPYYEDHLLPAGNLRESRSGADRADSIVITKCPADLTEVRKEQIRLKINPKKHQQVYFSTITYSRTVIGWNNTMLLEDLKNKGVTVITGIAKPDYFIDFLQNHMIVDHLRFPDHHNFTEKDLELFKEKELIITTEKDFVRLKEFQIAHLFYIPIEMQFLGATPDLF